MSINHKHHETLDCWKLSMQLVKDVYFMTRAFPADERFALTQQIRRAVCSVPNNIAEGSARETDKELIRGLYIARGSLAELETQMKISLMLGYVSDITEILVLIQNVSQTLNGYLRYVRARGK